MNSPTLLHNAAAALALLLLLPAAAHAQQQRITGRVVDPQGDAVSLAELQVLPNGPRAVTTDAGTFVLGPLADGTYTVRIRRLGFEPTTVQLLSNSQTLAPSYTFTLTPIPVQLDTVRRILLEQQLPRVFERMRDHVGAVAFGPELMKEYPGYSVDDMLRLDPGLWHQLLGETFCPAKVFIDGQPMPRGPLRGGTVQRGDLGIRLQLRMRDIAAIEAFRVKDGLHEPWVDEGERAGSCGRTIMIWTKGYQQKPYKQP